MKAIILAAGQGKRLNGITRDKPKCMVTFRRKPLIRYILENLKNCGIDDISLVVGYKEEVLRDYLKKEKIKFYNNPYFENSNMVFSLFCAINEFDDDLIISYSDIVYIPGVLKKLIKSRDDISITVDLDWKKLWTIRMTDPLQDAETMKIGRDGSIIGLGKKTKDYNEIEGQYMGLIKIKRSSLVKLKAFYKSLDKKALYDGQSYRNMYMTTFLQLIIDNLLPVKPVFVKGGWIEIDTPQDLRNYRKSSRFLKINFK